ncbi:hypothetical protein OAG36_00550 [bacterium]|nr:hypothetical protein [bacterium]
MAASEMLFEFKVLKGRHAEGTTEDGRQMIYRPGDTIKTKSDLRRFNTDSGTKFELLNEMKIQPAKTGK